MYLWLIHIVDVWQKPSQYSKVISLQLKINCFKNSHNYESLLLTFSDVLFFPSCIISIADLGKKQSMNVLLNVFITIEV